MSLTAVVQNGADRLELADLITVSEAARRIGIHRDTLYGLCRTGQFTPAVRIGRQWRVSVPRLHRYLHGDAA